jgi:hypothetical protein
MQEAPDISQILGSAGVQWNSSFASYTNVEQHCPQLRYYNLKNKKQYVYSNFQLCNNKPFPNSLFEIS